MTALTLKSYQQTALDALTAFARAAQLKGPALAFAEQAGRPYNLEAFGAELPCVCLRIPTGGGKTVLAAHAVPLLAREWCQVDAPVAVWLGPSDAIRQQTLKALQTPGHPYRVALTEAYGEQLQVCTLDEVAQIAPPDWGRTAVVVVATMQSFRIEDAGQRTVYSFSERFEPHFKGALAQDGGRALAGLHALPDALVTEGDAAQDTTGMLQGFVGQPRWSLANCLRDQHREVDAQAWYAQALAIFDADGGSRRLENPQLPELLRDYARSMRALGREAEAAALEARSVGTSMDRPLK